MLSRKKMIQNDRVFYEAKLATCIPIIQKAQNASSSLLLSIHPGKLLEEVEGLSHIDYQQLMDVMPFTGGIPLVHQVTDFKLVYRMYSDVNFELLKKHLVTFQGEINETTHIEFLKENSSLGPIVYRGSNVQRYDFVEVAKQGKELYLDEEKFKNRFNQGKIYPILHKNVTAINAKRL